MATGNRWATMFAPSFWLHHNLYLHSATLNSIVCSTELCRHA